MFQSITKYFSLKVLPVWTVFLLDTLIIIGASFISYYILLDRVIVAYSYRDLLISTLWTVLMNIVFFRVFHTYAGVIRFSSFVDIMRIFNSLTISFGLLELMNIILRYGFGIKFTLTVILLMTYVISLATMSMLRIAVKTIYDLRHAHSSDSTNVFIYGAKEYGANIAKALRSNMKEHYRLRGFFADEPEMIGKDLVGVRIYALDENFKDILNELKTKTIIVSPAKMDELKSGEKANMLLTSGIKVLAVPSIGEWTSGTLNAQQIKEVQIEDLLMRDPIKIDMRKIAEHLEGKRVLITGAAGSIGSEIMRQVASFNPYKLILVDQAETPLHDIRLELQNNWSDIDAETIIADIANQPRMEEIFKLYKPQYIFHAAAYKHVPMMENNVSESIQTNVAGTKILADLAVKYGTQRFVMVSTDKAVNPSNVMGCSKRICEIYVQALAKTNVKTQFITTRFGNVLGSNGSVIPLFKKQIAAGGPVTVTHPDIIRYFMTIPEACRLVLEAGSMGHGGEIYIFDMGEPVKIVDLAKRMISLSGRSDVAIKFTGLRHGEKLYEELLNIKENTKPTDNEKIMIANVREYDFEEVKKAIDNLIAVSYTYDEMNIVKAMKDLVPEFKSLNSKFSELDEEGK